MGRIFWHLAYVLNNPRAHWASLGASRRLMASQWLDRPGLDAIQREAFERLLDHARRTVPYYGRILSDVAGHSGEPVRERLACMPVLTKAAVRANGPDLCSRDPAAGRLYMSQTGGSTGEPLVVGNSREGLAGVAAAVIRGRSWAGVHIGDPGVSLKAHGRISLLGYWRSRLLNNRPFSSSLSPEHLRRHVIPALQAHPPRFLLGYPTSLMGMADLLEPGELHIPFLFSTGEMLYPHQRERLQQAFGARTFNAYGSNEVSGLAFECDHGQLHVTDEQVVLEVVDDDGRPVWEQPGRILVTDLRNRAMPFIRYELGDRGVLTRAPCACGRGLTVLKELEGRTQDAICGPNGVRLTGVIFAGRFRFLKRLRAYQVLQTSATGVELRYVSAHADPEPEVREMAEWIRERLGPEMQVSPVPFAELPLTRSGKTRLVIGLGTRDPGAAAGAKPRGEGSAP